MGNWWTPVFDSSSTSPSSTRPSSPGIAQNTSNEGTHSGSTRLDEDFPNEQILTPPNLTFTIAGLETAIRNFWRERVMGDSWIPHFDSSSTSPSSTRPSSPGIAQNTSNEGTHLGTGSALSTRLAEDFPNGQILTTPGRFYTLKVVVRVDMHDAKSRCKAMKTAVGLPGVKSVAIEGIKVVVIGHKVDPISLIKLMRKKVGHAEVLTVVAVEPDA